jgi:transcription elongation factor Elf1
VSTINLPVKPLPWSLRKFAQARCPLCGKPVARSMIDAETKMYILICDDCYHAISLDDGRSVL